MDDTYVGEYEVCPRCTLVLTKKDDITHGIHDGCLGNDLTGVWWLCSMCERGFQTDCGEGVCGRCD